MRENLDEQAVALGVAAQALDPPQLLGDAPRRVRVDAEVLRLHGIVITSYSIHYTKLYEKFSGPRGLLVAGRCLSSDTRLSTSISPPTEDRKIT